MKYFETEYDKKYGRNPIWWGRQIIYNKKTGLHYAFFSDTDPSLDENTICTLNMHQSRDHLQDLVDEMAHFHPNNGFDVTEVMKNQINACKKSVCCNG